jgi:hypothetical protein
VKDRESGATSPLLPPWELFAHDYIDNGVPCLYVVQTEPRVSLFVDQGSARIGATFALTDMVALPISPLDEIRVSDVSIDHHRHLEVSTTSRLLYRNFYLLMADIISGVVSDGLSPPAALEQSLQKWHALLSTTELMTEERQLGLFGELWMLQRLLPRLGLGTLDAWTGPAAQAHDFRVGTDEFEVKTTSGAARTHTISSLDQLMPSTGCSLYILSIQLAHAGAGGTTLGETVQSIVGTLEPWDGAATRFLYLLAQVGYKPQDAVRYSRRRKLRTRPQLVLVGHGCPRLVPLALAALPPTFAAGRIRRAVYDIDLEGLGFPDEDPRFLRLLPLPDPRVQGTHP